MVLATALVFGATARAQDTSYVEDPGTSEGLDYMIVEFSNFSDREAASGGGAVGGHDPEQCLKSRVKDSVGPIYPFDSIDYGDTEETGEVDALAATHDYLFDDLWNGVGIMTVSFRNEAATGTGSYRRGVYYEKESGECLTFWVHKDLNNPNEDGGTDFIEEVDALQSYGPPAFSHTAYFSLEGDPIRATRELYSNTSIFQSSTCGASGCGTNTSTQATFVERGEIWTKLFDLGFSGTDGEVDLDALMIDEAEPADLEWDTGDRIIFSIRAAGNFHGGEIIKYEHGQSASFLSHGGHAWDTEFDPTAHCSYAGSKDVDGLEMIREVDFDVQVASAVPSISFSGLTLLGALIFAVAVGGLAVQRRHRTG